MEINIPEIVAEVVAVFARYEHAVVNNDVAVLDELFRVNPHTIRYGATELPYGYEEIAQFRAAPAGIPADSGFMLCSRPDFPIQDHG